MRTFGMVAVVGSGAVAEAAAVAGTTAGAASGAGVCAIVVR